MQYNPSSPSTTYNNSLQQEYNKAVQQGFKGTFEDYLKVRDHT